MIRDRLDHHLPGQRKGDFGPVLGATGPELPRSVAADSLDRNQYGRQGVSRERQSQPMRHGKMRAVSNAAPDPRDRASLPEAAVRDHLANERTLLAWQRTARWAEKAARRASGRR
jgi:hypothetical protein